MYVGKPARSFPLSLTAVTQVTSWLFLSPTVYPEVKVLSVIYAMPSHGTMLTNSVKQDLFMPGSPFQVTGSQE